MKISVSDAKGQLTELVRRAEAGDEVVLTRHGKAVVRLAPVAQRPTAMDKRKLFALVHAMAGEPTPGPDAARSQDFLYGDDGMPK
jgi:prevent-host-death family protein